MLLQIFTNFHTLFYGVVGGGGAVDKMWLGTDAHVRQLELSVIVIVKCI